MWVALLIAVAAGFAAYLLVAPGRALAAGGAAIGLWLVAGSLTELAQRAKVGKAPLAENVRRLRGLPRGAWGMTLAHIGLGVLALGGSVEIAGKLENAQPMKPGDSYALGTYVARLDSVNTIDGPNFVAQRSTVTVTRNGKLICVGQPERRTYAAGGDKNVSAICSDGLSHFYVTMGEKRTNDAGVATWMITSYEIGRASCRERVSSPV